MNGGLKERIRDWCHDLEIPLVGFAPAARYEIPLFEPWVPTEFRPQAILPGTNTVIVIGLPVSLPVLETTPSIWYHELYRTVNTLLDIHGYRLAAFLTAHGHPSVAIPRDGYGSVSILKKNPVAFFSHRHAAFLAGLGSFGINNTLLTRQFGPRVRFTSVFTSAEIPPDPLLADPLCTRCGKCVRICPENAISGEDYPAGLVDRKACAVRSEVLARRHAAPCGLCIMICPVGDDRKTFWREDGDLSEETCRETGPFRAARGHVQKYGTGQGDEQ